MKLKYGFIEKFDEKIHGCPKNRMMKKYLKGKYLCFRCKEKDESLDSFYQEGEYSMFGKVELIEVYQFNGYYLAKDRSDIIRKIQNLYREWIRKRKKKFNVKYLFFRQTGYNLNKKKIYN